MAKVGSVVKDESLEYSQEIFRAQEASLNPLQEDLAEWLSRVLGKLKIRAKIELQCVQFQVRVTPNHILLESLPKPAQQT